MSRYAYNLSPGVRGVTRFNNEWAIASVDAHICLLVVRGCYMSSGPTGAYPSDDCPDGYRLSIVNGCLCMCPCCESDCCPCACYSFDGHANDNAKIGPPAGTLNLTSTNPVWMAGKLSQASQHTNGASYHKHTHDECYVPNATSNPTEHGPLGINVWFWLKRADPGRVPPPRVNAFGTIEYVATKGNFANPNLPFSDVANVCTFPGTWSIFSDASDFYSGQDDDLCFAVAYSNNCVHVERVQSWENPTAWVFFYWWYEPTAGVAGAHSGKMSVIRNNVAVIDAVSTVGVGGVPMRQTCTSDFEVGKRLGVTLSETVGIDNLGVSRCIGTKPEMTARAAALYNGGAGLRCPAGGE